jgi:hypothetical protein
VAVLGKVGDQSEAGAEGIRIVRYIRPVDYVHVYG